MTTRFFDSIVIGGGQAGTPLAIRLAEAGHRTLLVEREHVGGTCVNDGCTPTKAMVASARAAHVARTAAAFGVSTGPVSVDMAVVKARTKTIVQASIDGLREWIARTEGLEYLAGHARFTGPRSLSVGADTYEARRMFINVGARTSIPPIPGLETVRHLTNATIIELAEIPEHLIVVGGSYIGLEFAQMFRRFGARVTVVEQGARLIAREDPDVSDTIRSILEGEGIAFHLGAADLAASGTDDAVHLALSTGGRHLSLSGSHLLIAAGRRPNTDDLGLEKAASPSMRRDSSKSTTASARASRGSRRWATSTAAARSRTPRGTTTRSSPPTSSTARTARSPTAFPSTACSSTRLWAASA